MTIALSNSKFYYGVHNKNYIILNSIQAVQ